jgi:ribonuclease R
MNSIAKIYIQDNRDAGAINFETDEIKFELDEKGVPLRVIKKQRLDTHKMIEQYMLLANKEVAEFMWNEDKKMKGKEAGLIYRTHDVPKVEKIKDLSLLVRALGYNLELSKEGEVTAKALNMLLKQIEGTPEENLIRTASVRSMSKAIYTTANTGHFGLAFEFYTHFTSPIRRYPDLLVHRIMQTYLTHQKLTNKDVAFFAEAAASSTEREISASDAERSSIKYKQVEYWAPRIGTVLNGVISGVTEWGVYVEEDETKAEGMIRLKAMKDDTYVYADKQFAIIGQKTGKKISLGDKVKMKLVGADLDKKSLDFEFVD